MLLCKKIKLEVSEEDAQALEFMQAKCRGLYNWWMMRLRDGEHWPGWKEAKATLQGSKQHDPELQQVYARLRAAGGNVIEQGETTCCYAKSEKSWIDDPAGISWETFLTTGESIDYGDGSGEHEARIAHKKPSARCGSAAVPERPRACGTRSRRSARPRPG